MVYFLQPVHNVYLLLVSEVGIVGLGLFGFIVSRILLQEKRSKRQDATAMRIRVACYMSLVALGLLGFVDHYPVTLQQGQLLMTLCISLLFVA